MTDAKITDREGNTVYHQKLTEKQEQCKTALELFETLTDIQARTVHEWNDGPDYVMQLCARPDFYTVDFFNKL